MEKQILVSDPDRDGNSHHVVLCAAHLRDSLRACPLSRGQYVLPADADADCEECEARELERRRIQALLAKGVRQVRI